MISSGGSPGCFIFSPPVRIDSPVKFSHSPSEKEKDRYVPGGWDGSNQPGLRRTGKNPGGDNQLKRMVGCSVLALMFLVLLMTGCGGGGGSSSPPRPSPPAIVSTTGGIGEVTVTWESVTGVTSYNIYYSTSPNVKKATGTKVTGASSPHRVTGLAIGTIYYFVVTTVDANGESAESVEVSAAPVFPAPTDVRAFPGDNTATIRWTAVAGATSYNVYHSPTSPVTKTTGTKITGANSGDNVTGLTNGIPYYFVVTAQANGLESSESLQVTATPTPGVPTVPSGPTGVNGIPGAGSATISWTVVAGDLYNIYYSTSPGVTTATGTKVTGATSPAIVPNLIRGDAYYFVVTAENAAGESGVSNEVTVTPNAPDPVFSQADLAGTWNVRVLRSAPTAGWYSKLIDIDSTGNVKVIESGSAGTLSIPEVSAFSFESGTGTLAGVVTEFGVDNNATFHGRMSSRKNLIVGISTQGTSVALHIYVKRIPGITYSNVDLANKSFEYERIYTGSSHFWERAKGSTNASGQIAITELVGSSGTLSPPASNPTISVSGTGIVTIDNDSTFSGVMASDKNTIIGTSSDAAGNYSIQIFQMRGQSYTQADLEGEYIAYAFHSLSTSTWARATWSTDLYGNVTVLDIVHSDGTTTELPDPWTNTIDAQGNVTDGKPGGSRGVLSYGKDLLVEVGDFESGSTMVIVVQ